MHTLEEVRAEYDRLDRLLGIDTRGIELMISRRAVRRLGSFRSPAAGGREGLRIMLSALILDGEELFWDTIRHEYAHAAVYLLYPGEKHGHDAVWRAMCRRVGCSGSRLAKAEEKAVRLREEKVRYIIRCERCGSESHYVRRGKAVELMLCGRGRLLYCSRCGGDRLTLLVKTLNKSPRTS